MRVTPLLLVAPALLAQAPDPSFFQKVKAGMPTAAAIKEDPAAAFAKAKALLPEGKLPFDKSNVGTAQKSVVEWRALVELQSVIANAAQANGQWEDAKDAAEKARDLAKEMHAEAYPPYTAFKGVWVKAKDEATKKLAEMKALEAKEGRTKEEEDQLAFMKKNAPTWIDNQSKADAITKDIDRNLKTLADQSKDFDPLIGGIEKRIQKEQEDLVKFKTKAVMATAYVNSVGKAPGNVESALGYLRRALVLDPSNKAAQHRIDVLLGKAVDKPEPAKRGGKKKGK